MVIEYQIKRLDPVKLYFYNLRLSRRTQLIILGAAAFLVAYNLFLAYRNHGLLNTADFLAAFAIAILGLMIGIPLLSFLMAKTQKRMLSIGPEGIETTIGTKEGKIPWKAVDSISATEDRILITGKNANALTIPVDAFSSTKQRQEFLKLASQYRAVAAR